MRGGAVGGDIEGRCSEREVWGLEAVSSVASEAKMRLDHVIVGDVEQIDTLPLPERFFDCVTCGDVLEHLKDPERFLSRLRKHLAPGAHLIANVPNIAHWSVIVGLLKGEFRYEDKGLLDRTHLHFFTSGFLSRAALGSRLSSDGRGCSQVAGQRRLESNRPGRQCARSGWRYN